jgi:adenylate kinase family enzyme
MRILILGNSGSGKSTLAAEMARAFGLPTLDLDTVAWVPGQIAVARDRALARADIEAFGAAHGGWVMEGCYAGLLEAALPFRPLLVFLDPGAEACVAQALGRPWEPHKYASKAAQDEKLAFLLAWIREYDTRDGELGRGAHEALFQGYQGPKLRLGTRPDAAFLQALPDLAQVRHHP